MPTPSPIIVASVGAIDGTVTTWPRSPISARPPMRPMTAEMIGMPIATREPKVKARMIIAATRPIDLAALGVRLGQLRPDRAPAGDLHPGLHAGSPASRTVVAISSVRSSPSRRRGGRG